MLWRETSSFAKAWFDVVSIKFSYSRYEYGAECKDQCVITNAICEFIKLLTARSML